MTFAPDLNEKLMKNMKNRFTPVFVSALSVGAVALVGQSAQAQTTLYDNSTTLHTQVPISTMTAAALAPFWPVTKWFWRVVAVPTLSVHLPFKLISPALALLPATLTFNFTKITEQHSMVLRRLARSFGTLARRR